MSQRQSAAGFVPAVPRVVQTAMIEAAPVPVDGAKEISARGRVALHNHPASGGFRRNQGINLSFLEYLERDLRAEEDG